MTIEASIREDGADIAIERYEFCSDPADDEGEADEKQEDLADHADTLSGIGFPSCRRGMRFGMNRRRES